MEGGSVRVTESEQNADVTDRDHQDKSEFHRVQQMEHHSGKRKSDDEHSKRPKVARACNQCRDRKVRCDGVQPVCGTCRHRQKASGKCTYPPDTASQVTLDYVERLESRIRQLESTSGATLQAWTDSSPHDVGPLVATPIVLPQQQFVPSQKGVAERLEISDVAHDSRDCNHRISTSTPNVNFVHGQDVTGPPSSLSPEKGVDGMGNIGITEDSYREGSSSVASFMEQVKAAVASRLALPKPQATVSRWKDTKLSQLRQPTAKLFVLPLRRAADEMLSFYWHHVHILYPFLHRPSFEQVYRRLWTGEEEGLNEHSFYCILNVIFALTCQLTKGSSPQDKAADGEEYFGRATQLLQVDVIGGGSLELIQALLLMGQYLQSTESPHSCWMVIGWAIRVAQGLELHLPHTSDSLEQQQDQELVRRLWHGCVFMDRMVAMTLGRPMVITKADALSVPFPASIDDEVLSSNPGHRNVQPAERPSIIEFYVRSLKLYVIQEDTLSALYFNAALNRKSGLSPMEKLKNIDFTTVVRIHSSLEDWNDSLPSFLKFYTTGTQQSTDPILSRQANILHLRYLQIHILLCRPILSLLLTPEVRTKVISTPDEKLCLPQRMALSCAKECVVNAQQVIDLIHDQQMVTYDPSIVEPLPAWWFEVFFVYTAAITLIPARVYEYIRGNIPISSLTESWRRALNVLTRLAHLSSSAPRCLAILRLLNNEIATLKEELSNATSMGRSNASNGKDITTDPAAGGILCNSQGCALPEQLSDGGTLPTTPLPSTVMQVGGDQQELFGGLMQDFTWFDSLPTDLLAIDDTGLFDLPQFGQM